MKLSSYYLRLLLGALLASSALVMVSPRLAISQIAHNYALGQERRYVTDGLFSEVNGQWQFKVNQQGRDLQFAGYDNVKGRGIKLTGVSRSGTKARLIYTWHNSNSTYIVIWQPADPDFARLQVNRSGRLVFDRLMRKVADP